MNLHQRLQRKLLEEKAAVRVDGLNRTLPMAVLGGQQDVYDESGGGLLARMVGNQGAVWNQQNPADRYRSAIYRIVNYINTTASVVPFALWQRQPDGSKEQLHNHPLLDLLYNPNPDQDFTQLLEALLGYKLLTGNTYLRGIGPKGGLNAGKPLELWALPPLQVRVLGGGVCQPVTGYELHTSATEKIPLDRTDVWHGKYWNPSIISGVYGLSPVLAATYEATLSDAALATQVRQIQQSGPPGVLWLDTDENADLPPDAIPNMRQRLNQYGGIRGAGQVPVMTTKVGFTAIGASPVELKILESKQASFRDLCGFFKIDARLLGDTASSTFNNQEQARVALYKDCILPELQSIAAGLTRWLCPRFGKGLVLLPDVTQVEELQQDMGQLATALNTAWWVPTQEKQRRMGVKVDEDLPEYMVPVGIAPLADPDEVTETPDEPAGEDETVN